MAGINHILFPLNSETSGQVKKKKKDLYSASKTLSCDRVEKFKAVFVLID